MRNGHQTWDPPHLISLHISTDVAVFPACRDGAPRVLCEPPAAGGGPAATPAERDSLADGAASADERRLPHTYDDGDLYEQLLKEYLEGAGAPGGGAATLQRVSTPVAPRTRAVHQPAARGRDRHMRSGLCTIPGAW
jgi:hypothetical protein